MTQHRFLTDPDLHEPIGISEADEDQVYVSDGAGSGSWQDLLDGAPGAVYRHLVADDAAGGTFTSGAWRTRTLNEELRNTLGASLASNQITLPAGSYYAEWWAVGY